MKNVKEYTTPELIAYYDGLQDAIKLIKKRKNHTNSIDYTDFDKRCKELMKEVDYRLKDFA